MFHKRTVIVVGAGASAEAGLPIGSGLAKKIAGLLRIPRDWAAVGDEHKTFANALRANRAEHNDFDACLELSHQIVNGLGAISSIDRYIDKHRHDTRLAQIAKAAIVHTILEAERGSRIFNGNAPSGGDPLPGLAASWYFPFGDMIVDEIPLQEIDRLFANLTIICFNYDRCIEEFLAHWLARVYAIDLTRCRQIATRLTIIRPYGQVAPLNVVAFGDTDLLSASFALGQNINTFTEQIGDRDLISRIKDAISEAEIIAFLGFGFHPQNMEILKPDSVANVRRILATGRGLQPPNAGVIADELRRLYSTQGSGPLVTVDFNSACFTLFERHGRALNPSF